MSEIKYLPNGKKVSVVGKLNGAEYIVQEIYVGSDGSEIPAGENFVVKSLLDEPRQTWQQKEVEHYEKRLKEIEAEYESVSAKVAKHQRLAAAKIKVLRDVASHAAAEQLETLEDFIAGNIKYLVISRWSKVEVVPFSKAIDIDERYYEGMKLVSIFGHCDGRLDYRVNQYTDGSGSWAKVEACRDMESATEICQQLYDEAVERWRNGDAKTPPVDDLVSGTDIVLAQDAVEYWVEVKKQRKADEIKRLKDQLAKLEGEVQA
jgi:hypothetical protein